MPALARGAALAVLLLLQGGAAAQAQIWPSRAVTLVVPFAAGGGTDVLGRIVARRASETLGQQVIVENVGGAGSMRPRPGSASMCRRARPLR
jgi:tripartite-type tricarboxylate transporter receptor subunit TctC